MFIELDGKLINTNNITEITECHNKLFYVHFVGGGIRNLPGEVYDTLKEAVLGDQNDKKV